MRQSSAMTELQMNHGLRQACAAHLKAARIAAHLSQEEVAILIGMDRSYYAKVEGGRTNISLEILGRIRNALVLTVPALPTLPEQVAYRMWNSREGRYSQEALGKAAGLSVSYVGRLERCETNVGLDQIEAIAKVLEEDPLLFLSI